MRVNGVRTDLEGGRDLAITHAGLDQRRNLVLATGEKRELGAGRLRGGICSVKEQSGAVRSATDSESGAQWCSIGRETRRCTLSEQAMRSESCRPVEYGNERETGARVPEAGCVCQERMLIQDDDVNATVDYNAELVKPKVGPNQAYRRLKTQCRFKPE